MKLNHGLDLAYCTNVHRGDTWAETFAKLRQHTLAVKERICPQGPFGIALRLSGQAARGLSDRTALVAFHRWLDQHHCYVFSIHSFPCGHLRERPSAAQVFVPDWTSPERLTFTNHLFDILAQLLPPGVEGSVSTLPGAVKGVAYAPEELRMLRKHLWQCLDHIERLSESSGRMMRLALEPGPYCLLETSGEVIQFFDRMAVEHMNDSRLRKFLTVNYDTCHFAVEYEEPANAIACLQQHRIRIGKIQLSAAVRVCPGPDVCSRLAVFKEDVYHHQVVARCRDGQRLIYRTLGQALSQDPAEMPDVEECRIHLHIPLHCPDGEWFLSTNDHVLGALDVLAANPSLCPHLEIETQTWEALPPEMQQRSFAERMVAEYTWTLEKLAQRGFVSLERTPAPATA